MSWNSFVVIYAFFGVNFLIQKFCPCKKMTNIRYVLVRGVYKGETLKLTVQRPTEGRLVSWTMKHNGSYVLNVKAKMFYSWDIASGSKFGPYLIFVIFWHRHHFQLKNLIPKTLKSRHKWIYRKQRKLNYLHFITVVVEMV